ncbi:MAG: hypothetical protein ACO1QS_04315 [Verrucomicrobiota bacterium]
MEQRLLELANSIEITTRSAEEKMKQARATEAHLLELIKLPPAQAASASAKDPLAEPPPEELIWDNGKDYIWLKKSLLPSMRLAAFRPEEQPTEHSILSKLSSEAQRLMSAAFTSDAVAKLLASPNKYVELLDQVRKEGKGDFTPEVYAEVEQALHELEFAGINQMPRYELNPVIIKIMAMDSSQMQAVNEAVLGFVDQVHALERQHLEIVPPDATNPPYYRNAIRLRIPPLGEAGAQAKRQLAENVRAILGDERAGYWLQMTDDVIREDFANVGSLERALTLSFAPGRYHVKLTSLGGDSTHSGFFGTPQLPTWWRPFIRRTHAGYELVR